MKVVIWGAGKGFKRALVICTKLNWSIVMVVDSDLQKVGKKIGENIIQNPNVLSDIDEETYVLVAASSPEIVDIAKRYTNLIIDWEMLSTLYKGAAQYPNYETKDLEDKNIRNCLLLKDREELLKRLSTCYTEKFNFVEVGVAFGDFSREILDICKPSKLFLVDAWEGERYGGGIKVIQNKLKNELEKGIVELKKGYSTKVLEQFENQSIDIIYIDTNHTYETTWEELLISRTKIKENGFICGHDYTKYNSLSRTDYGVYDAVNRFCVEYGYEICYMTMEKEGLHSYALRKII